MWAIVDVAEKERLRKKAAKLSEVYMKEKADYEAAIPKAPKWPKSAYVVFMAEQRAKVWKNNPDLKLMDITKVGSNRVIRSFPINGLTPTKSPPPYPPQPPR